MSVQQKNILILYGSETGNSEAIAKRIGTEGRERGLNCQVNCFKNFRQLGLEKIWPSCPLVIVTSSTGCGDPPQNAESFWSFLRRRALGKDASSYQNTWLKNVRYTVLGLGDSNYDRYQGFPRNLTIKLNFFGASLFYPKGEADDATDLADVVEPWIKGLWGAIDGLYNQEEPKSTLIARRDFDDKGIVNFTQVKGYPKIPSLVTKVVYKEREGEPAKVRRVSQLMTMWGAGTEVTEGYKWDREHPFEASTLNARKLTQSGAGVKTVWHLELSTAGSNMQIRPGGSIGVLCPNPRPLVDGLLSRLNLEGDKIVALQSRDEKCADCVPSHIESPCTVRAIFEYYVDITSLPSKSLLMMLSEYTEDPKEKQKLRTLASFKGRELYTKQIEILRPNLLETLEAFPSCHPRLDHLIDILPAQSPRYYSISNSALQNPDKFEFAFTVVDVPILSEAISKRFKGVCSNWLMEICQKITESSEEDRNSIFKIKIFPRVGFEIFALPTDLQRPILMVGAGTGVAVFRSFLQHRRYLRDNEGKLLGDAFLFYGCRFRDKDFLYREELEGFVEDKTLTELVTAFSRETETVIYVQDRLLDYGKVIVDYMFEKNAVFYVCGDALGMANSVRSALINILVKFGQKTPDEALKVLQGWSTSNRYLLDVWA